MQVGVKPFNLLKHSTHLQQTKYMLGYVDNSLIDVLRTDLYPQFMCLNAHFCSLYSKHPNKREKSSIYWSTFSMYVCRSMYVSFFTVLCMFIVFM